MLAITPRVVRTNGPQTAIRRLLRPARVSVLVETLTRNLSAAPRAASASSPQGWSYYCVECLSPYARGRASPYFPSGIRAARLGLDALGRMAYRIYPTTNTVDFDPVASLFRAYARELGVDLTFQGFEDEVANLPGDYGPPNGGLLLARAASGDALGCVALRPLAEAGTCEMKRLYVRPAGRGLGVGRTLASTIITVAAERGYWRMRLDTLSTLRAAIGLYRSLGFAPTEAYYETPLAGTLFMAREIDLPRSDLAASSL